ncbi:hypothetical protein GCM10027271_59160 [Saccharopolyspora gloriosae]|uniref:Uncharacterized protein n=1 Tax=Saccharopolyspora gloriosae TaxID=455344 RepID=A0A840NIA1_9PSEU|nr:hypothetical protein [Saccharopolyspora gloriosae]
MKNGFLSYSDHFAGGSGWKVPALGKEYGPGEEVPAPVKARRSGPGTSAETLLLGGRTERAWLRGTAVGPCSRCAEHGPGQPRAVALAEAPTRCCPGCPGCR